MVTTDPTINERRVWWERLIWVLDMSAYLILGICGVAALFHVSDYVVDTLLGQRPVILTMACLLTVGLIAFIGRLTRIWMIEYAANVFALFGAFMYAVTLSPSIVTQGATWIVFGAVVVCFLYLLRRFAELKIFTSEPRQDGRDWLAAALRRRTKNTVPRQHY